MPTETTSPTRTPTLLVTGATGHLGRLVIDALLASGVPASRLIAVVRDAAKAGDLAARGVALREADYTDPASLDRAFAGVDRVLLVSSSSAFGEARVAQHRNAIDAAKRAGVQFVAYTSILHADTNPMRLALDHRATEAHLRDSGIPAAMLRDGWYTENYTANVGAVVQHGVLLGSAKEGRIASAARADFAEAAAAVLAADAPRAAVYELAGDASYTLTELAAEIARQSGKPVVYRDLPEADYASALAGMGLPPDFAAILADSDTHAATGVLDDASRTLSTLIGRPTTPMARSVAEALAAR